MPLDDPGGRSPAAVPTVGQGGHMIDVSGGPKLGTDDVWHQIERASNAVLGHTTAAGAPRTSGIVFQALDRRIYLAVAADSWKARQISTGDQVSITVLVRRGGLLSLLFPIPPATITCHGTATVLPAGSPQAAPVLERLGRLLPPDRRDSACIIQIDPVGQFLTYGIGVPLTTMRNPAAARARTPVG
jgi:hypothetical protein